MIKLVTKTPETLLDTLIELCIGFCSRSVIVNDDWYVFKRGRGLLKMPSSACKSSSINGLDCNVEFPVGSDWSLTNNCITVFSKAWYPNERK